MNRAAARKTALLLSMLLLFSLLPARADSVGDRITSFRRFFRTDPGKAMKFLRPVDDPRIVDAIAKIYQEFGAYAPADSVLLTAKGDAVFKRMFFYLAPAKPEAVRRAFAKALSFKSPPVLRKQILKLALREKDEAIRRFLVLCIRRYEGDDVLLVLFKVVRSTSSFRTGIAAVDALAARRKNPKAALLLAKLFSASSLSAPLRAESLRSYALITTKGLPDMVRDALSSSSFELRLIAAEVVADRKLKDFAPDVTALLGDPVWQVRDAAVRACGALKIVDAVGPLIDLWRKEKGRIGLDIHAALLRITGKSFPPDWRYWKSWFENLDEPLKEAAKEGTYITYHGMKTWSKNLAFLIDVSGSMAADVAKVYGAYGKASRADGSRLDMVKAELVHVIETLPPDARFNIIAFETTIHKWRSSQTRATPSNKKEAVSWVERLKPTGGTNIYDALMEAFGVRNPGDEPQGETPDTVFLLSDGSPGSGRVTDADEILDIITCMNRFRRVSINTIGVGKVGESFLKRLAEENYGAYRLIAE